MSEQITAGTAAGVLVVLAGIVLAALLFAGLAMRAILHWFSPDIFDGKIEAGNREIR